MRWKLKYFQRQLKKVFLIAWKKNIYEKIYNKLYSFIIFEIFVWLKYGTIKYNIEKILISNTLMLGTYKNCFCEVKKCPIKYHFENVQPTNSTERDSNLNPSCSRKEFLSIWLIKKI